MSMSSNQEKTMLEGYIQAVRQKHPIVHCIANYVTATDCANVLLAIGASPIMADAPEEAAEITGSSDSLVLNLGTPSPNRFSAMELAGKRANELDLPVVLDPVGAGASAFRREGIGRLLRSIRITAIRGNVSEIAAMAGTKTEWAGVDAAMTAQSPIETRNLAMDLARQSGAVVVVTGKKDIITDGKRSFTIANGHAMMGQVTGTGCMLSCLIGAFLGADTSHPLEAVAAAVGAFDICGERAYEKAAHAGRGTGSYHLALIDEVSLVKDSAMGGVRLVCE